MANFQNSRSICVQALHRQEALVSNLSAFVGLDGFVDEIIHVVDKREDAHSFARIPTIKALANRIIDAAGRSTNIELVPQRIKLGGNGPIMANALASFGVRISYVGALGYPNLHPVFSPLANKGEVFSIAEAAHTDALEFTDGKLMLGKMTPLKRHHLAEPSGTNGTNCSQNKNPIFPPNLLRQLDNDTSHEAKFGKPSSTKTSSQNADPTKPPSSIFAIQKNGTTKTLPMP